MRTFGVRILSRVFLLVGTAAEENVLGNGVGAFPLTYAPSPGVSHESRQCRHKSLPLVLLLR